MSMQPSNSSFQELLGNGTIYRVPQFQRDYSWQQEHWEDLWNDIEALSVERYHYLGYIVLQRQQDGSFTVIDGQQRLITLSIIVLAAMSQIKALAENEERLELIQNKFIGFKHPVTLQINAKLQLNRNNNHYFRQLASDLVPANDRNMKATNQYIKKAFCFFTKKSLGENGEAIAQKIEDITNGMMVTKIIVEDDINAYKIFETLNARGVQLSTPDLLKNYLFSLINRSEAESEGSLDQMDEDWSKVVSNIGEQSFTDFVRYHHNFQFPVVTKRWLFTSIKKRLANEKEGIDYFNSLKRFAPIYAGLLNPDDRWWSMQNGDYQGVTHYLKALSLFNIRQPLTILMIAFDKFSNEEFALLARYLYSLSIRYNVICHFSPNEQENIYNKIAIKIHEGTYQRASHVKNDKDLFGRIYPTDAQFLADFQYLEMPVAQSSKKARFILSEIERSLEHEVNFEKTVLEHICPDKPNETWHQEFGAGAEQVRNRLGNMVLLQKDNLGRELFNEKCATYQNTPYKLANQVASYSEWNMGTVNSHQLWMGQQALKVWNVDISE